MKSFSLLLAVLVALALVCSSFGRYIPQRPDTVTVMKATVSTQDKEIMRMRAFKAAAEEMGDNADEIEMLKRVDEIADKLLREAFPDAYTPAPKKIRAADSTDIWENGTIVRYLARALCLLLAVGGLYAWWDPREVKAPDRTKFIKATPAASSANSSSNSRKTK